MIQKLIHAFCCVVVSVPYRGATFLNLFHPIRPGKVYDCFRPLSGSYISQSVILIRKNLKMEVSVPYRGATFLNSSTLNGKNTSIEFPSPIGELHFSIFYIVSKDGDEYSFRPLSGSYISQLWYSIFRKEELKFPSPIGELHFSILHGNLTSNPCSSFPSPIGELHFSIAHWER